MSYRVRGDFKTRDAWMYARDLIAIDRRNGDELPEANFIDEYRDVATNVLFADRDGKVSLKAGSRLWWSGNYANDSFLQYVAPKIMGHMEVIWFGEDGCTCGGFIIDDGEVTPCSVEMKLVPLTTTTGVAYS